MMKRLPPEGVYPVCTCLLRPLQHIPMIISDYQLTDHRTQRARWQPHFKPPNDIKSLISLAAMSNRSKVACCVIVVKKTTGASAMEAEIMNETVSSLSCEINTCTAKCTPLSSTDYDSDSSARLSLTSANDRALAHYIIASLSLVLSPQVAGIL